MTEAVTRRGVSRAAPYLTGATSTTSPAGSPTYCTLTTHSYFTLTGTGPTEVHLRQIDADHVQDLGEGMIPTGRPPRLPAPGWIFAALPPRLCLWITTSACPGPDACRPGPWFWWRRGSGRPCRPPSRDYGATMAARWTGSARPGWASRLLARIRGSCSNRKPGPTRPISRGRLRHSCARARPIAT